MSVAALVPGHSEPVSLPAQNLTFVSRSDITKQGGNPTCGSEISLSQGMEVGWLLTVKYACFCSVRNILMWQFLGCPGLWVPCLQCEGVHPVLAFCQLLYTASLSTTQTHSSGLCQLGFASQVYLSPQTPFEECSS